MSKLRLLRESILKDLIKEIPHNLDRYRSGDFDFLLDDASTFLEVDMVYDEAALGGVDCSVSDNNEVNCCLNLFTAMNNVPPYLARDGRLWTYLTHTHLLAYARKRWPIPADDEKATAFIKNHYFAIGTRGIERENAASRLWWMAALCNRVEGLNLQEALTIFLHQSDVRASLIERPTTSQSIAVFSALIRKLGESYQGNRGLFERTKFRSVMKELNLRGGVKLLGVLNEDEIGAVVDELAE